MLIAIVSATTIVVYAQSPSLVDSNLRVRAVVENLDQPTSTAFLGANDFLVLEKNTGQVKRVVNGTVQSTVLDLAVNFASERGLLSIALHPDFRQQPERLPVLDGEHHRCGHQRAERNAASGQPGGPLRLGWLHPDSVRT